MSNLWDTNAAVDHIITLLEATAGVQNVSKGAPASWANRVTCYAAIGPQDTSDIAVNAVLQRRVSTFVEFGYRVAGAVSDAETTLGTYLDEFLVRLYDSRNNYAFGGVGSNMEIEAGLSTGNDFGRVAGQELRTYQILIWVTQRENLSTLVAAL